MKLDITDNHVVVHMEGIWKFLALKSTIRIPTECIMDVKTEKAKWLIFTPKAGTNLPGVIMAGTFFRKSGLAFYFMRKPDQCITLLLENHRYSELVLQVDDKEKVASQIREKIS